MSALADGDALELPSAKRARASAPTPVTEACSSGGASSSSGGANGKPDGEVRSACPIESRSIREARSHPVLRPSCDRLRRLAL